MSRKSRLFLWHGVFSEGKRAVQLKKPDYEKYDLFVGMDSNNIRNMMRIFGSDPDGKVYKLPKLQMTRVTLQIRGIREDLSSFNGVLYGCTALLCELLQNRRKL